MLNKTKIVAGVATILVVGSITYGTTSSYIANQKHLATAGEISSAAVVGEASNSIGTTASKVDTSPIDEAVSAGIKQIEEKTASALNQIKQQTESEVITKKMEPKTIALDIKSESPVGEMAFTSAKISYDNTYAAIIFSYTLSSDKRIYPNTASAIDKNQNLFSLLSFGANPKNIKDADGATIGYEYNDEIGVFGTLNDTIDFSTVTLTYAFEGYDPVTVTFDIPGL